jgi:hypothetical protein
MTPEGGLPLRKSLLMLSAFCGAAMAFGSGLSAASERAGFRMTAVVKTVCRLELPELKTGSSGQIIDFGSFYQLCNARNGYRVTMRHPANMTGATLFWDGRAVPLSPGNETVIADESHAATKFSEVRLDVRDVAVPLHSLSFRIDPKGSIY